MKAAEERRQQEEEEEKRQALEKRREEKRLEREVTRISHLMTSRRLIPVRNM